MKLRKKNSDLVRLAAILALTALLFSGCAPSPVETEPPSIEEAKPTEAEAEPSVEETEPVAEVEAPETIKIGLVYPVTGAVALLGQNLVDGHTMAAEEINAAGGIKSMGGAQLELVVADTQGQAEIGISQVHRLVEEEGITILAGSYQSNVTLATTQVAEELQIPFLAPVGGADQITERGFEYTFKISPKGSEISRSETDFLQAISERYETPVQTIGLVYIDNLFGSQQMDNIKSFLDEGIYSWELVADVPYPEDTNDLSGVVTKLRAANPDVVFQTSYFQDGLLLSRSMNDQGYAPPLAWIGFGASSTDPRFFEAVPEQAENYIATGYWTPDLDLGPDVDQERVISEFESEYGYTFNEFVAAGYTGTYVLADALERCASADPQEMQQALRETNIPMGTKGNLFGHNITFPPDGQCPSYAVIEQFVGGEFYVIWPEEIAGEEELVWPAVLGTAK